MSLNFRSLDLNLLRVFDEVMSERSLTRAAHKLNITQPAVSNAMRRLRDTMIKPMIEDIEAKLANGAKYIVTEYLDKNCIDAVGADLFIRVPYGMAQQMREHFGLQKPIDALSDWFTNPYVMYKKLMEDETLSDKERLARLGELSSTWDAMRPWNV